MHAQPQHSPHEQEHVVAPLTAAITVFNPATGAALYDFAPASSAECRAAMMRARQASVTLRETPMAQRLEALDALLTYLEAKQEWLLDRIVAESGRSRTHPSQSPQVSSEYAPCGSCRVSFRSLASLSPFL